MRGFFDAVDDPFNAFGGEEAEEDAIDERGEEGGGTTEILGLTVMVGTGREGVEDAVADFGSGLELVNMARRSPERCEMEGG